MSDTGTPPPAPAPTPAPAPDKPWYDGIAGEDLGHLQNRGWDKLDARAAAAAAAKAHREAEKMIGTPAEHLLKMPKDASDAEGWKALYSRLGVPDDPKGYDFSSVKFSDGTELDENFTASIAAAAREAGVPKDKAAVFAQKYIQIAEAAEAAEAKDQEAALNASREALKIDWGQYLEANTNTAINAIQAAEKAVPGLAAAIELLRDEVGYSDVMRLFQWFGAKTGEDKFVLNGAQGGNTVMTAEGAQARLDALNNDAGWRDRFWAGDTSARQEFDTITRVIAQAKAARS